MVRPASSPLRSNRVTGRSSHRATGPPSSAGLGVQHRRASARRSRPSRWPAATSRPAPAGSRPAGRTPGSPAAACGAAAWATGRGRTSTARPVRPARPGARSDQTASTPISRTFSAPASASRLSVSATPGRHTSKASTSYSGRAAASAAVASPTPEPISTTSGASRPNQRRSEKPGLVDRLVRDHPALVVLGPRRGLGRREPVAAPGVAEHLPHPAAVRGQPLVRAGGGDALVHAVHCLGVVGCTGGAHGGCATFNERALTSASRWPHGARATFGSSGETARHRQVREASPWHARTFSRRSSRLASAVTVMRTATATAGQVAQPAAAGPARARAATADVDGDHASRGRARGSAPSLSVRSNRGGPLARKVSQPADGLLRPRRTQRRWSARRRR